MLFPKMLLPFNTLPNTGKAGPMNRVYYCHNARTDLTDTKATSNQPTNKQRLFCANFFWLNPTPFSFFLIILSFSSPHLFNLFSPFPLHCLRDISWQKKSRHIFAFNLSSSFGLRIIIKNLWLFLLLSLPRLLLLARVPGFVFLVKSKLVVHRN